MPEVEYYMLMEDDSSFLLLEDDTSYFILYIELFPDPAAVTAIGGTVSPKLTISISGKIASAIGKTLVGAIMVLLPMIANRVNIKMHAASDDDLTMTADRDEITMYGSRPPEIP